MKKLLNLGIIILLAACTFQMKPDNYKYLQIQSSVSKEAFDKGYKSAIILETSNNASTKNVIPNNVFVFENDNKERIELDFLGSTGVLYISPGHYKLVSGKLYGYNRIGNYIFTINQNYPNLKAEFEVVYLGNLKLTITKVNKDSNKKINYDVEVIDKFETYKILYEKLIDKPITKRLIKATNK